MAKAKPPESVTITYDLFDLPTTQHKAGLAGLLLQIVSMGKRKKSPPSYDWDAQETRTKVHVKFTEETTKNLFDDLYDADWVEVPPQKKPHYEGKGDAKEELEPIHPTPIIEADEKDNEKKTEGHVYLDLTPKLATLRQYLPPEGEWPRLWRDLIWQVIRDSRKRAPYIHRANAKQKRVGVQLGNDTKAEAGAAGEDEKGNADGSTWADLVKYDTARRKGEFALGKLSSALLLGAQATNAEAIPFAGRIDQNLLLHFWPLTSLVYVPRFVDNEGKSHIGRQGKDDKSRHFCLGIPDIIDLAGFLKDYPTLLAALDSKMAGHRPRGSLIDTPAEGGLSFVEHLARLVPKMAENSAPPHMFVSGVDYLHLQQDGNIVRSRSTGRVTCTLDLAERYRDIVGRENDEKPPFANPLFRHGLIIALLDNQPWYRPFGKLFVDRDASSFFPTDKPSKLKLPWFWVDARKRLLRAIRAMPTDEYPDDDTLPDEEDILAATINRFVQRYLDKRLMPEWDFPKYRKNRQTPDGAPQAREKLALRLFLEFRSRREQAFIDHFTNTFFSIGQPLGNKPAPKMFERVAKALMKNTADVKTLTLMALSANGWVPTLKKETAK